MSIIMFIRNMYLIKRNKRETSVIQTEETIFIW